MKRLWNDDSGAILSAEFVLLSTILVIGMVVGLAAVRDAVVQELGDVANAFAVIDQSYSYGGTQGCCAYTEGSAFTDAPDQCDGGPNPTAATVVNDVVQVCITGAAGEGVGS